MPIMAPPGSPGVLESPVLDDRELQERRLSGPWKVILFNDDFHLLDEVVFQVQKATGCCLERAEIITLEAHERGRAVAFGGSREECEGVAAILREIALTVEIEQD